jgi:hypothetical protein
VRREIHSFIVLILMIAIMGCSGTSPRPDNAWEGSRITGVLMDQSGQPIQNYVYAYGASRVNILGPADAMSEITEVDGVYNIIVPGGEYRLVARKRLSGAIGGPLRNGDMVGKRPETLVTHSSVVSGLDIVMRVFEQGQEGDPSKILKTNTVLAGVIRDEAGDPLAGAHAFAYQGDFRKDPPDFLSPITVQDGRFTLSLPGGGEYTIGARKGFRGRPRTGDLIGFWGNSRQAYEELDDGS